MRSFLIGCFVLVATLVFAQNKLTIVLPKKAQAPEKRAAAILQLYMQRITSYTVVLEGSDKPATAPAIYIGDGKSLEKAGFHSPGTLPDDAYQLEGQNGAFAICGGGADGSEFGVYTLLELLGCRRYSPRDTFFPTLHSLELPAMAPKVEAPAFPYRELHYEPAMDATWARWHKLKTQPEKKEAWGMFVHTFNALCPPEKYFDNHPEYFAWNGKQHSAGQLCLSNDTVLQIVVRTLGEKIREKPEARYWSVSQNDNFDYCRCTRCQASDRKYGSPAGTLIQFVNAVAARFPDKTISTLAYQYTRQAPLGIKPAPNVSICLCSIECNRAGSLETDPANASFVRDVEQWAALTRNLMIWDYVVQFSSYLCPFPNWHTLQPNVQFFKKHGVRMLFEQGSGRDRSEFSDMRAYFLAKLMWNPDLDANALLHDFRSGYYGPMADIVELYINKLTFNLLQKEDHPVLNIYGNPGTYYNTFLSDACQTDYWKLLDSVIVRVPEGSKWESRSMEAILPMLYVQVDKVKYSDFGKPCYDNDDKFWRICYLPYQWDLAENFPNMCSDAGIRHLNENGYTPEDYINHIKAYMVEGRKVHVFAKNAYQNKELPFITRLKQPASSVYSRGDAALLTDGRMGVEDYRFNWLGFEGSDYEAELRLPDTMPYDALPEIRKIRATFLQDQASWVFYPVEVSIEVSSDGMGFREIHREPIVLEKDGKKAIRAVEKILESPMRVKAIRIKAKNTGTCPAWHPCNGNPCWIFTDEIEVR